MASRSSYLAYKRDSRHLLYWMIGTSNAIVKSVSISSNEDGLETANSTGQVTVASLVPMAELIAKHSPSIPSVIYRLFQSVIAARSAAYAVFRQMVASNPDAEIEKSNATHKHFIDTLTKAFDVLGGDAWLSRQKAENEEEEGRDDDEDVEQVIFANKFSALNLNTSKGDEEEAGATSDEASEPEQRSVAAAPERRRAQKKPSSSKGKKGRRGKKKAKGKRKPATPQTSKEQSLDDVPLESYRIIEDEEGLITDYLMAVYALVRECIELRCYVDGLWREVAYDGLNSAVAGAVSNLAIGMVKRMESEIFVDFPGHDSYETVTKTITRGNPEKARGMFSLSLHAVEEKSGKTQKVEETHLDVKEQFLLHTYEDLVDFIRDFQRTRSGKPTKAMLAEISNWDPNFNLQRASREDRIKWRRSYTINWLYDLVNLFSSIVVQRNTMKGEKHAYEKVDWSTSGPWNEHRRLFGLNEFAGVVTSLAMQKPGTDVRHRILPHHVFQLQCIVDSLSVSRGWSLSVMRGHVLDAPARGHRPRRDVDLFLDRENKRAGSGYLQAVDVLTQVLERDNMLRGEPNHHEGHCTILKEIQRDFIDWLGESKYMHGLTTIPPSRFSNTNANGLWEYSPFLCGVGLVEGLELVFRSSLLVWDRIPEPMLVIHLHNMLVQKGYLSKPVGLYGSLEQLFRSAFFADGKVPTSDFGQALLARTGDTSTRRAGFRRRAIARNAARSGADIHEILNMDANRFFHPKSSLLLYRPAGWVLERIPESDISPISLLGTVRLAQKKHVIDPTTGEKRLEDSDLVGRARAEGMDEELLLNISSQISNLTKGDDDGILQQTMASISEEYPGYRHEYRSKSGNSNNNNNNNNNNNREKKSDGDKLSGRDELALMKWDIYNEVSGEAFPLHSINLVWVTSQFMALFMMLEEKLKELRNPLYVRAYETDRQWQGEKRLGLTMMALFEEDEECLQTMANVFEKLRTGFMTHIYWKDLGDMEQWLGNERTAKQEGLPGDCVVM